MSQAKAERMKERRRQLRRKNAGNWLKKLQESPDPHALLLADYDNFLRALESVLQDGDDLDLAHGLLTALYQQAFGQADWDRWLVYVERGLQLSQESGQHRFEARFSEQLADLLRYRGALRRAGQTYRLALERLGPDEPGERARLLTKLASLHSVQGRFAQAVDLCRQALPLARQSGQEESVAHVHLTMSQVSLQLHDWEAALAAGRSACDLYQKLGQPVMAARALSDITAALANLGQWPEAEQAAEEALAVFQEQGDILSLVRLKNHLGIIAFNQGEYLLAEQAWQEALRLHSQTQEPETEAHLRNNLGMVYGRLEQWQAAEGMLQRAIALFEQFGERYGRANALDNLADLYQAWGYPEKVRATLDRAIQGLEQGEEEAHAGELLAALRARREDAGSSSSS